jgi:hypothetical protein
MIYETFLTADITTATEGPLDQSVSVFYQGTDIDTEEEVLSSSETVLDAMVSAASWSGPNDAVTSYSLKTYKVYEINTSTVLFEGTFS